MTDYLILLVWLYWHKVSVALLECSGGSLSSELGGVMLSWHICLLLGSTSLAASIFSKDNCHRLVLLDSTFFLPQVKQVCDFHVYWQV